MTPVTVTGAIMDQHDESNGRIFGQGVVLRPCETNADIAKLYLQITDPRVTNFLAIKLPASQAEFGESLIRLFEDAQNERVYIVARASDNEAIGLMRLHRTSQGRSEVSYWLGHQYWGHSFAYEGLRLLCDRAFRNWDIREVRAYCFVGNARSIALLERIGFVVSEVHPLAIQDPSKAVEAEFSLTPAAFFGAQRHGATKSTAARPGSAGFQASA
ncbi:MAG: hypothetical protein NVSMB31_16300 [Vulcanimicrobiaceae bacterium]